MSDNQENLPALKLLNDRDACRIEKHSVMIAGHASSVTLENIYWLALKKEAKSKEISLSNLIEEIDAARSGNLSSAIRLYLFASIF